MAIPRLVLLAALFTLLAGVPIARSAAADPTKVRNEEYSEEFRARVRVAVEKGIKFLRTVQLDAAILPDEMAYASAAAVTWVLRRSGVPSDDIVFARALKILRARQPMNIEEASLVMLALTVRKPQGADPFLPADASDSTGVSNEDRSMLEEVTQFVVKRQAVDSSHRSHPEFDSTGGWSFDGRPIGLGNADIPTTCLALLGLDAASRAGIDVPRRTWIAAFKLLFRWQAEEGTSVDLAMNEVRGSERLEWVEKAEARGFGWSGKQTTTLPPKGYETLSGAMGLSVCKERLDKDKAYSAEMRQVSQMGIRDALAWVQQNYGITKNPGGKDIDDMHYHHWLQVLAGFCIHARMRFVGGHDWYQEGAEQLMKSQREDGSWDVDWWSNCYALLFLMRANLRSVSAVVTDLGK